MAELGLVESRIVIFVRVQQRWGVCSLVRFFSLLSSFLILVGGTCPNFLDNNSQVVYGTALMVAKDFCLNVFEAFEASGCCTI